MGGKIEKALERVKERGFETWEEQERRKEKALALLKNSAVKCDSDHLLMLCKNYDFQEGLYYYIPFHVYFIFSYPLPSFFLFFFFFFLLN